MKCVMIQFLYLFKRMTFVYYEKFIFETVNKILHVKALSCMIHCVNLRRFIMANWWSNI